MHRLRARRHELGPPAIDTLLSTPTDFPDVFSSELDYIEYFPLPLRDERSTRNTSDSIAPLQTEPSPLVTSRQHFWTLTLLPASI